ncbi:MAG TPA: YggT family protein [Gaiellaceae bacterium]|jgi:YggT family protein|nr:YggT family protein [Gaiellaceae bacterium]
MLLDAVNEVELFVNVFVGVYILAILAYIITSLVQLPYSLRPIQRFLYDVCEPYLRLWRRMLPLSMGGIDFSPMVAVLALIAVERILIAILDQLH